MRGWGGMKCVILPSIATSVFADIDEVVIRVRKITFNELVELAKTCDMLINFNRHPPTNQLLAKYLTFVAGTEYRLNKDDRIFVIGLRTRAPVSGQDVQVTIDDLLILAVDIL